MSISKALLSHARSLSAWGIVLGLLAATHLTDRHSVEASPDVTGRFRFKRGPLPDVPGPEKWTVRKNLHPALSRLPAFMSGIGSSVAINDLDGDGLSNDLCLVESRTDQVLLTPAPGTGDRYAPFELNLSGILFRERMSLMGCIPGDFNEDGLVDVLVTLVGRTPMFFLRQNPGPLNAASFLPQPLVTPDRVVMPGPVVVADFDGDGHFDLLVANYFKDGADVYNPAGTGDIELPRSQSRAFNGGGETFFRFQAATPAPNPSVTYVKETEALPADYPKGWPLAAAAYDLDDDLLPEVYVAHDFGPDRLLYNVSTPGRIRFRVAEGEIDFWTPLSKALGHDSFKSMGVDFGDMNGDGLADIYVSNVTTPRSSFECQEAFINTGETGALAQGKAPFKDKSESLGLARTGWAWEARLADFDNDGVLEALQTVGFVRGTKNRWPELQELGMTNDAISDRIDLAWPTLQPGDDISGHEKNPFFVRVNDRYVNIASAIGFVEENLSRGIALGDTDGDGDLDMALSNLYAPPTFYENQCPNCAGFVGLHIVQPAAGELGSGVSVRSGHPKAEERFRASIGASVRLVRPDGRVLIGQVDGGGGHTGKRSPDLLMGLATSRGESEVTLRYRLPGTAALTKKLRLGPGWHTVVLGAKETSEIAQ
jgi:hypothetical protein